MDQSNPSPALALLHRRYRGEVTQPPQWNDTLTTLLSHRSVRSFLPDRLPDGMLETLIAAAQSASTSSNLQVWSVVEVQDPERRKRLSVLARDQRWVATCPTFLVWLCDLRRLLDLAAVRDETVEGPHFLELAIVGIIDAALAAQNAVAAAESLGLGTVYIGGIRNHPDQVAAELGLPPNVFAVFGMCIGYPDPKRPTDVKPRLPQSAVLHREQYDREIQAAAIEEYLPRLRAFQDEQGMKPSQWTDTVIARVRDAPALHGRDILKDILHGLGFQLR